MDISLLAKLILDELNELQAQEIAEIDVKDKTSVTDKIIVTTGRSSRHVASLGRKLVEKLKHHKQQPLSVSGLDQGDWVLVDCGDVIVHIMQAQTRAFYNIEGIWQVVLPEQSSN